MVPQHLTFVLTEIWKEVWIKKSVWTACHSHCIWWILFFYIIRSIHLFICFLFVDKKLLFLQICLANKATVFSSCGYVLATVCQIMWWLLIVLFYSRSVWLSSILTDRFFLSFEAEIEGTGSRSNVNVWCGWKSLACFHYDVIIIIIIIIIQF